MAKFEEYKHGVFSWIDLMSKDQAKAEEFYANVFGWEANRNEMPGGHYTMWTFKGETVAGCGQMDEAMKASGMPSIWNSYINVNNVDEVVEKAKGLGASIMMPAMDVMNHGRMAFITDPTGANFGVWEAKEHKGAGLCNEPNTLCWNELNTRDLKSATQFYTELLGWNMEEKDIGGGQMYTMIAVGEDMNGGAMPMIGPQWEGVPPNWMAYIAVEDTDAVCEKVKKHGGNIVVEPMDIAPGRMAVVTDPDGGTFTLLKMSQPG